MTSSNSTASDLTALRAKLARRASERAAKQQHSLKHISAAQNSAIRFRESRGGK